MVPFDSKTGSGHEAPGLMIPVVRPKPLRTDAHNQVLGPQSDHPPQRLNISNDFGVKTSFSSQANC